MRLWIVAICCAVVAGSLLYPSLSHAETEREHVLSRLIINRSVGETRRVGDRYFDARPPGQVVRPQRDPRDWLTPLALFGALVLLLAVARLNGPQGRRS